MQLLEKLKTFNIHYKKDRQKRGAGFSGHRYDICVRKETKIAYKWYR